MCKVRLVHFSKHDVRVHMTTDPFGHHDGPGDFTAPTSSVDCQCINTRVTPPRIPGLALFDSCAWHGCCVTCHQTIKCQWLRENGDMIPQDGWWPEGHCPNFFQVNEYHPISTILLGSNALPWDRWGNQNRLPYYPAAELFYSATITDAAPTDDESRGLRGDRTEVQHLGWKLRQQKKVLKLAIEAAIEAVWKLEVKFDNPKGRPCLAMVPKLFFRQLEVAYTAIQFVEREESAVIDMYQQMMRRTTAVLTMLNRMPRPGETLTVADGAFSISREQLDLGEVGREDVLDACKGPLNKSRDLRQHLDYAVAALRPPKKRKRKHDEDPRKRPIPGNQRMKRQKKESKFM